MALSALTAVITASSITHWRPPTTRYANTPIFPLKCLRSQHGRFAFIIISYSNDAFYGMGFGEIAICFDQIKKRCWWLVKPKLQQNYISSLAALVSSHADGCVMYRYYSGIFLPPQFTYLYLCSQCFGKCEFSTRKTVPQEGLLIIQKNTFLTRDVGIEFVGCHWFNAVGATNKMYSPHLNWGERKNPRDVLTSIL